MEYDSNARPKRYRTNYRSLYQLVATRPIYLARAITLCRTLARFSSFDSRIYFHPIWRCWNRCTREAIRSTDQGSALGLIMLGLSRDQPSKLSHVSGR